MRPRADILNIGFFDWNGEHLLTGGAERYVSDLCDLLIEAGYRPRLVQNAHTPFQRDFRGIEVVGVPAATAFDLPALAVAFAPLVQDAALVIASPVELAGRIAEGPVVIGINHGIWWDHPDHRVGWLDLARHDTLLCALRRAAACVCVDTNFINWLRTFDGEALDRLEYIPNYVDLRLFGPREKDFRAPRLTVLYPRRLCTERGIHEVFAAFDELFAQQAPFDLHLCGGGPPADVERARDFVARHPGRARLSEAAMTGMPAVYAESHIVVIPTLFSEGTSLACLEAMATRNGVVATHVGGLPNLVIDGMNGLLIKPGAVPLASALRRLADDRGLLASLAERAVGVSASFALDAWQDRWRNLLQRVGPAGSPAKVRDAGQPAAAGAAGAAGRPRHSMRAEHCALVRDLVSVVLPVHNGAYLLAYAIRSVLAQTYRPLELIIVDDGSTDGIANVLAPYAGHPDVRILVQPNQRLPRALSQGFAHARGEYWTWTSDDNLMEPHQLERMVARLRADPDLGMTYADYRVIDDRGSPLADPAWRTHNRPMPGSGEVRLPRTTERLNVVPDNFIGPCFLYRGWIGRLLGDYDPEQGVEDYDYWMRINALFSIRHLGSDDLLYWYRVHADTLSTALRARPIVDKVEALMRTERARAACFAQRPVFHAGADAAAWLGARGITDGVREAPLAGPSSRPSAIVAIARTAHEVSLPADAGFTVPLVLIFARGGASPYEAVATLGRSAVLAVVSDARDAARIRALSSAPVVDGEAASLSVALDAFVRHQGFRMSMQAAAADAALPAVPFAGAAAAPRVALQAERLTQERTGDDALAAAAALRSAGFDVMILVHTAAEDALEHAAQLGFAVAMRTNFAHADHYRAWLRAQRVDLVLAYGCAFGAEVAGSLGIPFVQSLRPPVALSAEAVAAYRAADGATTAYACASAGVAQLADQALGLDPSKFRAIGNRLDGEAVGQGDHADAHARLLHALLRR